MKTRDVIGTAVKNTFQSPTRTILTVVAIFIGSFTLTLTSGLGAGVNNFIDDTIDSMGGTGMLNVYLATEDADDDEDEEEEDEDAPEIYDPDVVVTTSDGPGADTESLALHDSDIDAIAEVEGVEEVVPVNNISINYVQHDDSDPYQISLGDALATESVEVVEGELPDEEADEPELALPESFVEVLEFDDNADAIDSEVELSVTNAAREEQLITATITGITEPSSAFGLDPNSITANDELVEQLQVAINSGLAEAITTTYYTAYVEIDPESTTEDVEDIQEALMDAGYTSTTIEDRLGTFRTVIDAIVWILNAFAIIALLAASFGIINTLYMSVQERTREIGLMKAMGMGSARVFAMFSFEAAFIGLLGSAVGIVVAMLVGTYVSSTLTDTLLADLTGLDLFSWEAASLAAIVLLVVGIAFLAGTFPALRASRKDPVESLRYE